MPSLNKRSLGQYFTQANPFHVPAFAAWMGEAWSRRPIVLEPFAGHNHIIGLVREAGWPASWSSFDIDPPSGAPEGVVVERRDTLRDFPAGFSVAITNPPYLARGSATRRGLPFPPDAPAAHDDLYKMALERMLESVPYVAAIVPESFVRSGLFHSRLQAVVALPCRLFADTHHPVCMALFVPVAPQDFEVWDDSIRVGTYRELRSRLPAAVVRQPWRFNDPKGTLSLHAVDSRTEPSIRFSCGACVEDARVKPESRAITRIGGAPAGTEKDIIVRANARLAQYRVETHDALLMAFRGVRKDGRFRRRLDFSQARALLDIACQDVTQSS